MDKPASVFRDTALRSYAEHNERGISLELPLPRTLIFWAGILLLFSSLLIISLVRLPMYSSGLVVVVTPKGTESASSDRSSLLVVVSPQYLKDLKQGRKLLFKMEGQNEYRTGFIYFVAPDVVSRESLVNRFDLAPETAARVDSQVAIALAELKPESAAIPNSALGSVYEGQIEVGSQRIISLLPYIGRFFLSDDH